MTTPLDRIRQRDELACLDAMIRVAHRMLDEVEHPLDEAGKLMPSSMPHVTRQHGDIHALLDDLHSAMVRGGREAFELAVYAAKENPICAEFIRRLDHWLTKMPASRIRSVSITTQAEEEEQRKRVFNESKK